MPYDIPKEVKDIGEILEKAGFEAYIVGGCVRDLLLGTSPKDWDITTNAKPEEIQKLFPDSVYENQFGTVGVKTGSDGPTLKIIEITTYRLEGRYTDKRHPDEIKFARTIEEDLSRRDFSVNAMALKLFTKLPQGATLTDSLVDPFDGRKDLKSKIIHTVGDPNDRFNEDALRLFRAVRFSAQLGFKIEDKTAKAIQKNAGLLEMVSKERIRDELSKLLITDNAASGIIELKNLGLLRYIMPELEAGIDVEQNLHHVYTVFEHNLRALDYAAKKKYSLEVRMAALLHDVGKPQTKHGTGKYCTFYNHEVVGAKITAKILERLRYSKDFIEYIAHLVRWHMFYYNVGEISEAGVRRFLVRVGPENIDDLLKVREADRIGSGVPKAVPYKTRHLLFMVEKVKRDPISPKALKVNGEDVMKELELTPSPRIGDILAVLLAEVIDDPAKNDREKLLARMKELNKLKDAELKNLHKAAEERKEEFESGVESAMKKKFFV